MGNERKTPLTPLEERLDEVLSRRLPGSRMELNWTPRRARVTALVIWEGFDEMDQIERQRILWDVLHEELSEAEQARLTAHLTVTPRELEKMRQPLSVV